jgi:hypothetical protein
MSSAIDDAAATERRPVLVDLALQGGGSHGAFTWGVLDRLLEEPWMKIEAISGDIGRSHECGGAGGRMVKGGPTARGPRLIPIGGVPHGLPPSARCNALPLSG